MLGKKKKIVQIIIAFILEFSVLFGIVLFQRSVVFLTLPLMARAVTSIAIMWMLLIVPAIFMFKSKENLVDIGFSKKYKFRQILTGILMGIAMSLVLTIIPILIGFKDIVGTTTFTKAWQFCYEFAYMILGVALVEEVFFRGFLFKRLMEINNSKWFAIIISSAAFGIFHMLQGNIIQVFMTMVLGIIFCLCREKINSCTTLSLIIAHGIYDALIIFFVTIL